MDQDKNNDGTGCVTQEKIKELAKLQGRLNKFEAQASNPTQPEPAKPPIIPLGDSNCHGIHKHLLTWMQQAVTKERAKESTIENHDHLVGSTVMFLCGTNDFKHGTTRHQVNAQHKEVTQMIPFAGATLFVVQPTSVYTTPQTSQKNKGNRNKNNRKRRGLH